MKEVLPEYFKPIIWDHDMSTIDPEQSPNLVISKAINYGDLRHWRWIIKHYGAAEVCRILTSLPTTALRPGARALAAIVFSLPQINDIITSRHSHA